MLYNLCLLRNKPYSNTAWANLPEEDQKAWDSVFSQEVFDKYNIKWVVYCETAWSSEAYKIFAINTQNDIPGRIEHWREIAKTTWYQKTDIFTLFGTSDEEPHMPDFPNPIYQLYMIYSDPAAAANLARETAAEHDERGAKWQESMRRNNACLVLHCDSYWANEEYLSFGLIAFPNIEARQQHARDLLAMNWDQYCRAFTLLGLPT